MLPDISVKLATYKTLLLKWSKVINLVAPSTLHNIEARHFNDSLQLLPLIPPNTKTLLDLGSGAGFPGLILAMALPDIQIHLVESDQRKCSFLGTVSRETNTPVIIHTTRIESVDKSIAPDVITARALADLQELLKLTTIFWEENTQISLIFPKGVRWLDEVSAAKKFYSFDYETHPSAYEKGASILIINNISHVK